MLNLWQQKSTRTEPLTPFSQLGLQLTAINAKKLAIFARCRIRLTGQIHSKVIGSDIDIYSLVSVGMRKGGKKQLLREKTLVKHNLKISCFSVQGAKSLPFVSPTATEGNKTGHVCSRNNLNNCHLFSNEDCKLLVEWETFTWTRQTHLQASGISLPWNQILGMREIYSALLPPLDARNHKFIWSMQSLYRDNHFTTTWSFLSISRGWTHILQYYIQRRTKSPIIDKNRCGQLLSHMVRRYHRQAASSQNTTRDDTSSDNRDVPGNKSCSRRLLPILILVVTSGEIQLSFSSYSRQKRGEAKANTPSNWKPTQHTEILRISFKSQRTHPGLIKIAHPTVCTIPEISGYYPYSCLCYSEQQGGLFHSGTSICFPLPFLRCIISVPRMDPDWDVPHGDTADQGWVSPQLWHFAPWEDPST